MLAFPSVTNSGRLIRTPTPASTTLSSPSLSASQKMKIINAIISKMPTIDQIRLLPTMNAPSSCREALCHTFWPSVEPYAACWRTSIAFDACYGMELLLPPFGPKKEPVDPMEIASTTETLQVSLASQEHASPCVLTIVAHCFHRCQHRTKSSSLPGQDGGGCKQRHPNSLRSHLATPFPFHLVAWRTRHHRFPHCS